MTSQGTVKLFNPNKGFGFITAADGTDVFLHIKACVDEGIPKQGDQVAFDMGESPVKPGMMQASNVTGGTGVKGEGKGGKGSAGTGAYQGTCKSFTGEKGFGFIIGSDGSDIFFHAKGLQDGSTPQAGDVLQFDLEDSRLKPGQMQAQNITGGTGLGKGEDKGKGKGYGKAEGGDKGWGKGDDSWGPYGGKDAGKGDDKGKGKGKGKGKAAMMEAIMSMMGSYGGESWGADSWSGGGW